MKDFEPGPFSDVSTSPLGIAIWKFLHSDESIACLETTTFLKRPALEGLQPHLQAAFGAAIKTDRIKQMTGRMVRQVMEDLGYNLDQTDVRIRVGDLYKSAARYAMPKQGVKHV
jgi:hypothetical protein